MPRNAIKKHHYLNQMASDLDEVVKKFTSYANTLTVNFAKIDAWEGDDDTPAQMKQVLITAKQDGIDTLQNMINNIP